MPAWFAARVIEQFRELFTEFAQLLANQRMQGGALPSELTEQPRQGACGGGCLGVGARLPIVARIGDPAGRPAAHRLRSGVRSARNFGQVVEADIVLPFQGEVTEYLSSLNPVACS